MKRRTMKKYVNCGIFCKFMNRWQCADGCVSLLDLDERRGMCPLYVPYCSLKEKRSER